MYLSSLNNYQQAIIPWEASGSRDKQCLQVWFLPCFSKLSLHPHPIRFSPFPTVLNFKRGLMFQHVCFGVLLPIAENKNPVVFIGGLILFKGPFVIATWLVSTNMDFKEPGRPQIRLRCIWKGPSGHVAPRKPKHQGTH